MTSHGPAENQAVLDCASALAAGEMTVEEIALTHGAAVGAEAEAVCRSRARLVAAGGAVHLSIVAVDDSCPEPDD